MPEPIPPANIVEPAALGCLVILVIVVAIVLWGSIEKCYGWAKRETDRRRGGPIQ